MALTPKGRTLYDRLLNQVRQAVPNPIERVDMYYHQLEITFRHFPDNLTEIRRQGRLILTIRLIPHTIEIYLLIWNH